MHRRFPTFVAMTVVLLAAGSILGQSTGGPSANPPSTPRWEAHSHNDYLRQRPLHDALEHQFGSVEADIYLVDGKLLVAHDRDKLRPDRSLESLYLNPLAERCRTNHGWVYREHSRPFHLLIDIKADAAAVWPVLTTLLHRHRGILTEFTDRAVYTNAVTVILSGDRPIAQASAARVRHCAIDGRPDDLERNPSAALMPWISTSWSSILPALGESGLDATSRERLAAMVARAHGQGRTVRLWGAPDRELGWKTVRDLGVDWINTDRLTDLSRWLDSRRGSAGPR